MPRVAVHGGELYYEEWGSGPPVVFVHGAGGNHLSWWQQVPEFSKRYRCITYDQRGYGSSVNATGDAGTAVLAADLLQLLDHLEIETTFAVGQSLGGWAVWGLAEDHPRRVRGLVMADTPGNVPAPEVAEWAKGLGQRRQSGENPLSRAVAARLHDEQPALAFLYYQIQGLNPPNRALSLGPSVLEIVAQRGPSSLSTFTVPSLFIVGEEDALIPPPVIEAAAAAVPNAQLLRVPEAGHSVYFEKADVFNNAVMKFFDAVSN